MIASTSFSDARRACPTEQAPDAVLVGHLSAVDPGLDHQSLRVHEQVALPAADLLAAVEAPLLTADAGGLGRLRVEDAGTRLGIPTRSRPRPPASAVSRGASTAARRSAAGSATCSWTR